LDQLYVLGSDQLQQDLARLEELRAAFMRHGARLAQDAPPSAAEFAGMVGELDQITRLVNRLSGFASLAFAQDATDQKALSFMSKLDETLTVAGNDLLFFELWWKNLPDGEADVLAAGLPDYGHWLSRTRAFKPHTLSEAEEKIINLKNVTGSEAMVNLYDAVTTRYRFDGSFLPDGQGRPLTREELGVHVRSAAPEIRQGAYRELHRVYGEQGPVLAQLYQTVVRDWRLEQVRLRRHPSPQAARHKANDLSQETVDSLLRVCRQRAPEIFGRYFRQKARRLGLPLLRRYDLYAPLAPAGGRLDFAQGLREVAEAFRAFGDDYAALALEVAEKGRLSARPAPGKQSGAFCASIEPGAAPWVLMSFNGQRQDLFTLAHELGHAVHSQLAGVNNVFHFHSSLPLAETASTFGEMLLAQRLAQQAQTEEERDALRFHLLDDAYATVGRQAFFALFEIEAHDLVEAGATADELAEAYWRNISEQFGDSLELSEEFRWEWVSIPHFFHTPFYVYAYSFGQLLVYSLWRVRQRQGPEFVPRFKALLARGGSASPEAILAEAGLGPLDDDFWASGFEVIESFLPD
jgi:oligoendopeptidase F